MWLLLKTTNLLSLLKTESVEFLTFFMKSFETSLTKSDKYRMIGKIYLRG